MSTGDSLLPSTPRHSHISPDLDRLRDSSEQNNIYILLGVGAHLG